MMAEVEWVTMSDGSERGQFGKWALMLAQEARFDGKPGEWVCYAFEPIGVGGRFGVPLAKADSLEACKAGAVARAKEVLDGY